MAKGDKRKRSIVKTLTFRVFIIITDTVIGWLVTHRVDLTAGFVIFTNLASTFVYYLHERIWARIKWGRAREQR